LQGTDEERLRLPQCYEVESAFDVLHLSGDRVFEVETLPHGAIITVAEPASLCRGFVEVLFEGMILAAYLRDIEDWTERVGQEKGQERAGHDLIASGKNGA
jgi:hypothetical protein